MRPVCFSYKFEINEASEKTLSRDNRLEEIKRVES